MRRAAHANPFSDATLIAGVVHRIADEPPNACHGHFCGANAIGPTTSHASAKTAISNSGVDAGSR